MTLGHLVALLVVIVAFLGLLGVVPFTPVVIFGLILAVAIAVFLGGYGIPWPPGR